MTPTKNTYAEAVDTVRKFLMEMDLNPEEHPDEVGTVFRVTFEGPAEYGIAQVRQDTERFVFYFSFAGQVRPERRSAVGEYLSRVNWGIIDGNFEFNLEDGTVRYKLSVDFSTVGLPAVQVRNMILSGMEYIEIFADGLVAVGEGRMSALDAYREARSRDAST